MRLKIRFISNMPRLNFTECQKKIVAARQKWMCSVCNTMLTSTYQVDHTKALCDGGANILSNATAMCPNCHAVKTQNEHIERTTEEVDAALLYATREDVVHAGKATCSLCHVTRNVRNDHMVCREIEMPGSQALAVRRQLQQFAFVTRKLNATELPRA